MKITISKDLSFPADLVTQVEVILAKRRAGKSYTMRRIVEQLLKTQEQVVIVDPKGDQWGIRSSADGKKPGYPVLILGGEHGDLPLEVNGGELVARLVVEQRVSILIDLSQFRKHEIATFMTAFMENLYRLKAQEKYRTPMKLVVDEADAIAPQKPQKGEERMLGAIEDIVRRGGQRGIGCMLVTQRSAVLNKNVLTQAQMIIVLRTIAPQDIAAMKAWIDVHGTAEQGKELIESLPSLPIGDAWFWSPGWPTDEGIFKRVHVLPIETFDSGATPKQGQKPIVPKNLADVDLDSLKEQMAATIETAKQNDPKALRAEITRLTSELSKSSRTPIESNLPMGVSQWREYGKQYGYWDFFEKKMLEQRDKDWTKVVKDWEGYANGLYYTMKAAWEKFDTSNKPASFPDGTHPLSVPASTFSPILKNQSPAFSESTLERGRQAMRESPPYLQGEPMQTDTGSSLKAGARKMLGVLVSRHPMKMNKSQFATLSGMSPKSSTFDQYLAALRRAGLINVQDGIYTATDVGIEFCGDVKPTPQSPEEVRAMWRSNLKAGAAKLLDILINYNRTPIEKQQLAADSGMSFTSSTFDQYVAMLKRNGLVDSVGTYLQASEMFY